MSSKAIVPKKKAGKEVALKEAKAISLFPSQAEWDMLKEQASVAVRSGFLPKAVDTPEKAIAIALKGRELGIPPMQAFAHIHIIQGKPTISAELMLSLIYKNCPGAVIDYIENGAVRCAIRATRPGSKAAVWSFTIDEARKASLLGKDSWRNYPAAMLRARTISIVARAVFPDAIMGCSYTPEELGAEVNDDGEVAVLPPELPRIYADQPGPEDGTEPEEPREFQFRKGKFVKRTPENAEETYGLETMRKWVETVERRFDEAKKKGIQLSDEAVWREDVEVCARHIAQRENAPVDGPRWDEEEIGEGIG